MTTQITRFEYGTLDDNTILEIQHHTANIKSRLSRTVEDILSIGASLIAVKAQLEHGQFGAWLQTEFGMSSETARNFMNVATRFGGDQKPNNFEFPLTVLYQLARPSTPEDAAEHITELQAAGESITTKLTRDVIKQAKAAAADQSTQDPTPAPDHPPVDDEILSQVREAVKEHRRNYSFLSYLSRSWIKTALHHLEEPAVFQACDQLVTEGVLEASPNTPNLPYKHPGRSGPTVDAYPVGSYIQYQGDDTLITRMGVVTGLAHGALLVNSWGTAGDHPREGELLPPDHVSPAKSNYYAWAWHYDTRTQEDAWILFPWKDHYIALKYPMSTPAAYNFNYPDGYLGLAIRVSQAYVDWLREDQGAVVQIVPLEELPIPMAEIVNKAARARKGEPIQPPPPPVIEGLSTEPTQAEMDAQKILAFLEEFGPIPSKDLRARLGFGVEDSRFYKAYNMLLAGNKIARGMNGITKQVNTVLVSTTTPAAVPAQEEDRSEVYNAAIPAYTKLSKGLLDLHDAVVLTEEVRGIRSFHVLERDRLQQLDNQLTTAIQDVTDVRGHLKTLQEQIRVMMDTGKPYDHDTQ